MKKPIATIIAAAGIMVAFAETSTNTSPAGVTQEKKYPWESSVSAGLTLTQGNSDTVLINLGLVTKRKTPTDEYVFGAEGAYGENNSVKNTELFHIFGQYNHLFNERFFDYARADVLHDGIADLHYRVTLSPGVGYYFIKEKNTTLAGEFGPGVEFQSLGVKRDAFATVRFAERFEHKFASGARFWQTLEYIPQVDDWNNYLVNAEIGLEAAISKNLSLKTSLSDSFVNKPAAGRKNNDLKLVAGVAYKF
jgi:putative salt-induced outer membrane protein YdiY